MEIKADDLFDSEFQTRKMHFLGYDILDFLKNDLAVIKKKCIFAASS